MSATQKTVRTEARMARLGEELRPIPDPTELTTAALLREINGLKELLQTQIVGLSDKIEHNEKHLDTRHGEIKEEVDRLKELFVEKFRSIDVQFQGRDKLQDQTVVADRVAVTAALQAQKESMAKTEAGFTKQIDQQQALINAIAKATDDKIDDLKTRLTLIEGKAKGIGEGWGIIVAAGGLATGILIAVASYIR